MTDNADKNLKLQGVKAEKAAFQIFAELAISSLKLRGDGPPKGEVQSRLIALIRQELKNIRTMWESFTTDREELSTYLNDPAKSTSAYLLGFHLPNMIRTLHTWRRLEARGFSPKMTEILASEKRVQIVDIGCGTGAIAQATALSLKHLGVDPSRIHSFGVDRNGRFLDAYRHGLAEVVADKNIAAKKMDLHRLNKSMIRLNDEDLNIAILGYSWNEFSSKPQLADKIFEILTEVLKRPNGMVLVLEPANQTPARETMQLRDALSPLGDVLYPCQGSGPCPMLKKKKDWCYSEFTWDPPRVQSFLDKRLGVDRSRLKSAALVVASKGMAQTRNKHTLVGRPLDLNKRIEYLICGEKGLSKLKPKSDAWIMRGEEL